MKGGPGSFIQGPTRNVSLLAAAAGAIPPIASAAAPLPLKNSRRSRRPLAATVPCPGERKVRLMAGSSVVGLTYGRNHTQHALDPSNEFVVSQLIRNSYDEI